MTVGRFFANFFVAVLLFCAAINNGFGQMTELGGEPVKMYGDQPLDAQQQDGQDGAKDGGGDGTKDGGIMSSLANWPWGKILLVGAVLLFVALLIKFRKQIASGLKSGFNRGRAAAITPRGGSTAGGAHHPVIALVGLFLFGHALLDAASFSKLDPYKVEPGITKDITVHGAGFGSDIKRVMVGFSSDAGNGHPDIPVSIKSVSDNSITMTVRVPSGVKDAWRQLYVKLGEGTPQRTALFLHIIQSAGSSALDVVDRRGYVTRSELRTEVSRYVTNQVTVEQMRRVDAKADRALGLAETAHTEIATLKTRTTATENALTSMGTRFNQLFGDDGNGGTFGKRLSDAEDGLKVHADAIKDIRVEIDKINARVPTVPTNNAEFFELKSRVEKLESVLNALLNVKTGVIRKKTLGTRAGVGVVGGPAGGFVNAVQ